MKRYPSISVPLLPALSDLDRLRTVPTPRHTLLLLRFAIIATSSALLFSAVACHRSRFPDVPAGYREYAYVSNGGSNTVSVLDLVYLRQDRTLQVGTNPSYLAANPVRNEIYVVNTQSGSVSVIDVETNRVVSAISVHRSPTSAAVDPAGERAYVTNSGSNTVSILDLDRRREIGTVGTGEQPRLARVSADGRTLVVVNGGSGSISIFGIVAGGASVHLRSVFRGCPGASDAAILPDSSKVFVSCSLSHQVMAVSLAAASGSWAARQDATMMTDHLLTLLDVGITPVELAMKPDGGEIFVSNYGSDSVSEISTLTNEVGSTFTIGSRPVYGVVSADNGTLWVSNFGADTISVYSIDDGRLAGSVHTGSAPSVMAFSVDEHLLLAADARSGDVAVIRTQGNPGPALFTMLPAGVSPNSIVVKSIKNGQLLQKKVGRP